MYKTTNTIFAGARIACAAILLLFAGACAKLGPSGMYLAFPELYGLAPFGGVGGSGIALSGTVSGLAGKGLVLSLNGTENQSITQDGSFQFSSQLAAGSAYAVTVTTQPVSPVQTCAVNSGNGIASSGNVDNVSVTCSDSIAPEILSVSSYNANTIRVIFSESVSGAAAAAFRVTDAASGFCSDNSRFIGATPTADFTITSVTGSGAIYDLGLSALQTLNKSYTLVADRASLADLSSPANPLGCPSSGDFTGRAAPDLSYASCAGTRDVILTFSKPMLTGVNAVGGVECDSAAECAKRFKMTGAAAPGSISSVRMLDGTLCNGAAADTTGTRFCLTHANAQTGGLYSVIGSNASNGDGFDDAACGAFQCALRNSANTESLRASPHDRYSFTGCGTAPSTPGGGPVTSDPFGDGTTIGQLTAYRNKIYIGPNTAGNGLSRFNPDGSNPAQTTFSLNQHGSMRNTGTQTGSLGHTGCTTNSNNIVTGCGPDNEDGRAFIKTTALGGTEYLFFSGRRSGGDYRYIYFTGETDTILNSHYVRLDGTLSGGVNFGSRTLAGMNDRVYIGFATGLAALSPGLARVSFNTADAQFCPVAGDCVATAGNHGDPLNIGFMDFMGRKGFGEPNRNHAALINIDAMIVYNGLLYIANGGHHEVGHNGSIVRSNNGNPAACASSGVCPDWTEIGPRGNAAWHNTNARFSLEIDQTGDLIPADLAFPAFAEFNGNLYVIRNTCTTAGTVGFDVAAHTTAGCNDGTTTNREAQLWKCTPAVSGAATSCEAGDWTLVAQNGVSGITNMGDANNRVASMLLVNGGHLYVGFDNVNGVQLWRTRNGITNPAAEGDFEQIGGSGFGNPAQTTQIYSAVSAAYGGANYLYISAGNGGVPVAAFVQRD